MKKTIIILILLSVLQVAYGQVETKFFPKGDASDQVKPIKDYPKANKTMKLSSFDVQKLIDEDKLNQNMDRPFRFGKGFDIGTTLADGEWSNLGEARLWSMGFQSNGAYSINFVFDQLFLSDGAKLYVTNASGTMLYGPVTSKQNTKNGYFLTDLIQGDNVTIYLYEPISEKGKSKLSIKRVVHAYKNLFSNMAYGNLGGSESCNNDISCFPAWDDESDAVALVLLANGTEWCSGSLLMTANQSFRPYFLSAFHCIDDPYAPNGSLSATEISNAENWMFKFQYKMTSCGGSSATTGITYNGATFRAAWNSSDFALMEMDNSPIGDSRFAWLGWDRSGNTPTSGTGIHHPAGDVMKISFDTNQFQTSSWGGTNNHWLLAFDDGVVQKGSSGSPILDQNNRVVGQLHGNQNYNRNLSFCDQPRAEYGRFNNSWTGGGTNATRLSNWLDPCASGVMTTNTTRIPSLSGSSSVCSSGTTYTINGAQGFTVSWTCSSNISFDHQTGNPKTFTANGTGIGTIQAILIPTCGNNITLPAKTVWVGPPHDIELICEGRGNLYTYSFYVTPFYDGDSIVWGTIPATAELTDLGYGYATIAFDEPGIYDIWAYVTNECGDGTPAYITDFYVYELLMSPNPASTEVEITISAGLEEGSKSANWYSDDEYTVTVLDIYGTVKIQRKYSGNKFTIPVSSLKDGSYIVKINSKKINSSKQLIVKH
jgi:lysyl endopeptidase